MNTQENTQKSDTKTTSTKTATVPAKTEKRPKLSEMTATQLATNVIAIAAMFAFLEKEAFSLAFSITKGLRISAKYAGSFVANLSNSIAKNAKDEGIELSALEVLNDFRNAKNYKGGELSDVLKSRLTTGRVNAYARILGKRYDAVLAPADVHKAIVIVSDKMFNAIPAA